MDDFDTLDNGSGLSRAWQRLLNIIAPTACRLCATRATRLALCRACLGEIRPLGSACQRCARPTAVSVASCGDCLDPDGAITRVYAPFRYEFPLDRLLHALKYRGDLVVMPAIALALQRDMPRLAAPVDVVVPVPLHRRRLRARGFNQSELLARVVGRALGVRLAVRLLRRARDTRAQSELPAAARRRNVLGAFRSRPVRGGHVLLVDDVLTTGATADAAARALLDGGADCVSVLALMRAAV